MTEKNNSQYTACSLVVKVFGREGKETPLVVPKCDFQIGSSPTADYVVKDGGVAPLHAAFVFFQDKWYVKNTSGRTDDGVVLNGKPVPQDMLSPLDAGDVLVMGKSVRMSISSINKPVEWQNWIQENTDSLNRTDHSSDETVIDVEDDIDDGPLPPSQPSSSFQLEEEKESFFRKYSKILWTIGGILLACLIVMIFRALLS